MISRSATLNTASETTSLVSTDFSEEDEERQQQQQQEQQQLSQQPSSLEDNDNDDDTTTCCWSLRRTVVVLDTCNGLIYLFTFVVLGMALTITQQSQEVMDDDGTAVLSVVSSAEAPPSASLWASRTAVLQQSLAAALWQILGSVAGVAGAYWGNSWLLAVPILTYGQVVVLAVLARNVVSIVYNGIILYPHVYLVFQLREQRLYPTRLPLTQP